MCQTFVIKSTTKLLSIHELPHTFFLLHLYDNWLYYTLDSSVTYYEMTTHTIIRAFILNVVTGCSSVISGILAFDRGAWRSAEWRGIVANRGILKPWIFFGNHAEILKWECEMISFPKVWITITAPLMNTSRTGLRNRRCCIHKHFFRTHNNWALFSGVR